jgi:hypothetical protein
LVGWFREGRHFLQGGSQRLLQPVTRHLDDVQARLTRSGLQVFAGVPVQVEQLALRVDERTHRRVLEQDSFGQLAQWELAAAGRLARRCILPGALPQSRHEVSQRSPGAGFFLLALEDLPLAVDGGEQLVEVADALRRAQEEQAARIQSVVK